MADHLTPNPRPTETLTAEEARRFLESVPSIAWEEDESTYVCLVCGVEKPGHSFGYRDQWEVGRLFPHSATCLWLKLRRLAGED